MKSESGAGSQEPDLVASFFQIARHRPIDCGAPVDGSLPLPLRLVAGAARVSMKSVGRTDALELSPAQPFRRCLSGRGTVSRQGTLLEGD